jgi:hypothetical protein
MTRNITPTPPHLPINPAALRRVVGIVVQLGGMVLRRIAPSGEETLTIHVQGEHRTLPVRTLFDAGWVQCKRIPHQQCACDAQLHGARALCRVCGSLSEPLPQSVQRWVSAQRPRRVGDE